MAHCFSPVLLRLQQEGLFASTYATLATFVASDAMENSHVAAVDLPVILNALDQASVFALPLPSRIAASRLWTSIANWISAGRPHALVDQSAVSTAVSAPIVTRPLLQHVLQPTTVAASLASLQLVCACVYILYQVSTSMSV